MKRSIFIILICACNYSWASITDSLEFELQKAKKDTVKISLLDDLVWNNLYSDIDKAEKFGRQAVHIASKSELTKFSGRAHHSLATVFLQKNQNDSALFHFKKAIKIYEELGLEENASGSYNGIGNVYLYLGIFEKSLEYYLQSLRLLEKKSSNKQKIGLVTANVGIVYFNLENYDKAIEYYSRALKIAEETSDSSAIASCYSNLGNIYKDLDSLDKAENYLLKGAELFRKAGETYGIGNCLSGLGAIYQRRKDFKKAISYYKEAFSVYEQMKNEDGLATIYFDFGGLYAQMKKYPESIQNINKSIEISRKISALNRVMEGYSVLHEIYAEMKDYKKSYEALMVFVRVRDSVLNEENTKNVARMHTIYETEKKEQQLAAQDAEIKKNEAELKQKTIQRNAILFGGLLSLLLLIVAYKGYRDKKKANISITIQKEIIEQKNKDITDSINYAKRIQAAILPPEQLVKRIFPQSFVYYQPRDIVSGDFYFFAEVGNKKIAAACDCTGHGVPGAFMSMIGNEMLHRIVNEQQITDTARILNLLHKDIVSALNQESSKRTTSDGMDIAIICYDETKKEIQYSGAVRPLYYFNSNGLQEVRGDRYSIGYEAGNDFSFSSQNIPLSKGDTIYLFSDGYADQFGGNDGKKFMARRFKDLLISFQDKEITEHEPELNRSLQQWKKEREQVDDILVIGIRV